MCDPASKIPIHIPDGIFEPEISCDPSFPRWCDKLSLDSEGNIRNFDGSIVGRYDMNSIKNDITAFSIKEDKS